MQKVALLCLAGALGTVSRYAVAGLVEEHFGSDGFPWGTLAVNVIGCFLAGMVWVFSDHHPLRMSVEMRAILMIGFMGAFTTFSAFMMDTGKMLHEGNWLWAFGNVTMQNVVGAASFFAGFACARWTA